MAKSLCFRVFLPMIVYITVPMSDDKIYVAEMVRNQDVIQQYHNQQVVSLGYNCLIQNPKTTQK